MLFTATAGGIHITGRAGGAGCPCCTRSASGTCSASWPGRAGNPSCSIRTGGSGGACEPLGDDEIKDMLRSSRNIAHFREGAGSGGNGTADDNGIRRAFSRRASWARRAGRTRNQARLTNWLAGITGTRTAAVAIVNVQNENLLAIVSGKGFPTASICRTAFECEDGFDTACQVWYNGNGSRFTRMTGGRYVQNPNCGR